MPMRTDEIIQRYLAAESARVAAQTEIAQLRDLLLARGREAIDREGAAPTWRVPTFGVARIDGYGAEPKVTIVKPEALAEYLAGVEETLVEVTITGIPASRAAEALDAVRDMAMIPEARIETQVSADAWDRWAEEHVRAVTGSDGETVAQHVEPLYGETAEPVGVTVIAEELPGTQVIRPALRLVVSLDPGRKRKVIADAKRQITAEIEAADAPPPLAVLPQQEEQPAPPVLTTAADPYAGWSVSQLRQACREAGLKLSGSKAELHERLLDALDARMAAAGA